MDFSGEIIGNLTKSDWIFDETDLFTWHEFLKFIVGINAQ